MVIVMYSGRRGTGKTLTLVKDAKIYQEAGWKIYSNITTMSFADEILTNEEIINAINNDELQECVLCIDEIQLLIDSRRSMKKQNLNVIYFVQQIRKRGVHILATTQYTRRVDVGFREHVDIEARPNIHYLDSKGNFVVEVIYTDLTAEYEGILRQRRVVYNPKDVFKLYDTEETIEVMNK